MEKIISVHCNDPALKSESKCNSYICYLSGFLSMKQRGQGPDDIHPATVGGGLLETSPDDFGSILFLKTLPVR